MINYKPISNKLSEKNGFTLAEMLTITAIIVITLTLTIPGVMNVQERLKIAELNDTARQIYMTAQNSLTIHQTNNTVNRLKNDNLFVDAEETMWISSHDASIQLLLPEGSIESVISENHCMIKLNLRYATVLEVYYAESNLSNHADDIKAGILANDIDSADKRRDYKIGFYQGSKLEWSQLEQLPIPVLEVKNGEELTAIIKLDGNHTELLNKTQLTLHIEELDANGSVVTTMETAPIAPDISTETKITLDSLSNSNKRFRDICSGITPGADIRITAVLKPLQTNDKYLPSTSNIVQTNSLFETRSGDTVSISNRRHLQNLHENSGITADITNVVQTANIDLKNMNYISIENPDLKSFNGNQLKIRNLNSSNGLFHSVENASLQNIRLVDPVISNGSSNTGTLAGTANNTHIDRCWVYAETKTDTAGISSSGSYVGGLVGKIVNCDIDGSFASLPLIEVHSTNAVGGLIGSSTGSVISNSYAATNYMVGDSHTTAMFIGDSTEKTKVNNCYAIGSLAINGNCYGFACGSTDIRNSYCAVSYISDKTELQVQDAFASTKTHDTCYYLNTGETSKVANSKSYFDLRSIPLPNAGSVTAAQTHPYSNKLQGQAYPFLSVKDNADNLLPFYGDWNITVTNILNVNKPSASEDSSHPVPDDTAKNGSIN